MRRAIFFVLALALPVLACSACGKKGLPPECDKYLVQYDCYMAKSGMAAADRQKTLDGMRETWTTSSNTSAGRTAIVAACGQMQGQMTAKFAEAGCK
jgi:hypothetical protein